MSGGDARQFAPDGGPKFRVAVGSRLNTASLTGILLLMTQPGRFRILSRNRAFEQHLHPAVRSARRVERILLSLMAEIQGGEHTVRIRQIFERPREIYRLEIESLEWGYLRTTLLDRDTLEELLAQDGVRERIEIAG